jgi:hypothetical protein
VLSNSLTGSVYPSDGFLDSENLSLSDPIENSLDFEASVLSTTTIEEAATRSNSRDASSESTGFDSRPFSPLGEGQTARTPRPTPAPKRLDLGLILGIVFAILLLLAVVTGLLIYKCRSKEEEEGSTGDPNREFFWLEQRDHEKEMSVDFNNPMYDEKAGVGEVSDDFTVISDEGEFVVM